METRKLFYEDPRLRRFAARVVSCREREGKFLIQLEETAFYPEGGGQAGDTGTLGSVRVLDTREEEGQLLHICDGPLDPGSLLEGQLDWEPRFHRMQQHTGEHMVSGVIHSLLGFHNTGFHMGAEGIVIDFDGVIPQELLPRIEEQVNRGIWQDIPVKCWVPSREELPEVTYRTKRALPWPVRIVEVPGFDSCACCGVHCSSTGQVGLVKLFSSIPFRGGSRVTMACGGHALAMLNTAYDQNKLVSQAFSARIPETGAAAQRMNQVLAEQKFRITGLERRLWQRIAGEYRGHALALHFEPELSGTALRELADTLADAARIAAVFTPGEDGCSYCLASRTQDLRTLGKEMITALGGRGGGKPNFQQGKVTAGEDRIRAFWAERE